MAQLSKSSHDQRESTQDQETPEVKAPCSDAASPHVARGTPKAKSRLVFYCQNLGGKTGLEVGMALETLTQLLF